MRINVYHEELTDEVEFVEKHVEATGKTYYGLRLYMKSPPELHHSPEDDDRTAITFWFGTKLLAIEALDNWRHKAQRLWIRGLPAGERPGTEKLA